MSKKQSTVYQASFGNSCSEDDDEYGDEDDVDSEDNFPLSDDNGGGAEGGLLAVNTQTDNNNVGGGKPRRQRRSRGNSGINGAPTDSRQRRLEKNRESARESRKRKKNYISSLEAKMAGLEAENNRLRNVLQNYKEREKLSHFSHLESMD